MSDPTTELIIAKRNIQALHQALKDTQGRIDSQEQKINALQTQVAQMQAQFNVMQQAVTVMRVSGMGRGPTT